MRVSRRNLLRLSTGLVVSGGQLNTSSAQPATTNPGMVAVLTQAYDNSRSGANLRETTLTAASVQQRGIAKKFSLNMTGDRRGSEAQTLIVPNILMADGLHHDLAIQASMSGAVFTFDANSGELLWMRKYVNGVAGSKDIDWWLINDHWGILSTPVIDADTNIMYFVGWSSSDGSMNNARFIAHAVHIADGSAAAAALDLSNTSYNPGHSLPTMQLGTIPRKQRCGLVLTKVAGQKVIFVAFAAGAESAPTNHGWVVALSPDPFRITAGWNDSPHYQGGGIWMGAQAPAADAQGNIYFISGNGAFDGVTDFGESFIKLKYAPPGNATAAGDLECVDWWTPFTDSGRAGETATLPLHQKVLAQHVDRPSNAMINMPMASMPPGSAAPTGNNKPAADITPLASNADWTDQDLGSAGALLIPELNLLLGCGKDGILYVLDVNNLGKTALADFGSADGINKNYAKAKSIDWFTYFPGWNVSPTPTDLTKLNFFFANRTHHQHSTPIYYHSGKYGPTLFTCGENGPVRVWSIDNAGQLKFLAYSDEYASPNAPIPPGGMAGGMMCLSANGQTAGSALLTVCFPYGNANSQITPGFFAVYDAENFTQRPDGSMKLNPLWKSSDWGINYNHCKFNRPVVSGGKIFIPTYDDQVLVFALT